MNHKVQILAHQYDLLEDDTTKILGLTSGFGAGKTFAVALKALKLAKLNEGFDGIVTEPNYPLLVQILIPEIIKVLKQFNIPFVFSKGDMIFTLALAKPTRIICKSLENYDRLVGINAAWAICDEFDTTRQEVAYKAYFMLLGRLRVGKFKQLVLVSTPEGFRAMYKIFIEEADSSKRLIQAKTTDNIFLPEDYIETMQQQYPPALLEAYINGKFVNLTSGTIYNYFNRERHHFSPPSSLVPTELFIGQDFNVGGCCSVVYIKLDSGTLVGIDELASEDTKDVIHNIKAKYPKKSINIYPDASGNARKSSASQTDIQMLRQAGFKVFVNSRNPTVRDRINIANNCFDKNIVLFDTQACPRTTKALEQHAYNTNGEPDKFSGAATIDDWTDAATYPLAFMFPIAKGGIGRAGLSFA